MGLNWKYQDKDFTEDLIGDNYGFVYQITNLTNGRKYIGKKFFYSAKTKQVKGKKKKIKVPSDWQTYYGSSAELSKDVLQLGHEQFNREILHLCLSKGDCGYLEAKEQFVNGALESDEYYNTWIMVRVRKSHLKGINVRLSTKTEK
jgi:antitoxin component YwqK of YwqJK toxin-antitoxin module